MLPLSRASSKVCSHAVRCSRSVSSSDRLGLTDTSWWQYRGIHEIIKWYHRRVRKSFDHCNGVSTVRTFHVFYGLINSTRKNNEVRSTFSIRLPQNKCYRFRSYKKIRLHKYGDWISFTSTSDHSDFMYYMTILCRHRTLCVLLLLSSFLVDLCVRIEYVWKSLYLFISRLFIRFARTNSRHKEKKERKKTPNLTL